MIQVSENFIVCYIVTDQNINATKMQPTFHPIECDYFCINGVKSNFFATARFTVVHCLENRTKCVSGATSFLCKDLQSALQYHNHIVIL